MLTSRQQEIVNLLKNRPFLPARQLLLALKVSRARLNQLIVPLIRKKLVKREGSARATIYRVTDKRTFEQISKENWTLKHRIRELEKIIEDRRIIEQAKELLIAQFDIPPTEAYRKLQEQSMDSGKTMREIAEAILSAYEV